MRRIRDVIRVGPVLGLLVVANASALSVSSCSCGAGEESAQPAAGGGGGRGGEGGRGGAVPSTSASGGEGGSSERDAGVDSGELPDVLPDVLPDFTEEEREPVAAIDGIPSPLPNVYEDLGPAATDASFRALVGFKIREGDSLEETIADLYDPASPEFRRYLTVDEWMAAFAPLPIDVHLVKLWLEAQGFRVNFTATNRLLVQFSGTVGQFNSVFQTELRLFERENPQAGNPPIDVYGTLGTLTVPTWVSQRITGIVTCDLPASTDPLPNEIGEIVTTPPPDLASGRSIAQIASAYDVDDLYALGHTGEGVSLGITVGATFKFRDLQSFWRSLGVTRTDPRVVETMEPIATRYLEATIDVAWSGAIAPAADLVVYEGPDSRNTSMLYTFNEAIARNEVSVITNSFAHREDAEPPAVRRQYHDAARMAAALGITVIAATGDSSETDTPSASPYVTGAGGTQLELDPNGAVARETAWSGSGSGASLSFALPYWQEGIVRDSLGKRAVADVALNASPAAPYWVYYLGTWRRYGGTSFASPVFAGIVAVVNSHRAARGLPQVGFLNPVLYMTPSVQATFRDVVSGSTPFFAAGPGWDYPTGWGAPSALGLANALP